MKKLIIILILLTSFSFGKWRIAWNVNGVYRVWYSEKMPLIIGSTPFIKFVDQKTGLEVILSGFILIEEVK